MRFGLFPSTLFVLGASLSAGTFYPTKPGELVVPNEYLVKFMPGVAAQQLLASIVPGSANLALPALNIHKVTFPPGTSAADVMRLAAHLLVSYVEPNRIRKVVLAAPNDLFIGNQYALNTLQASQAWNIMPDGYLTAATATISRVKVAVIDTGIDCTHPDFKNAGGTSTDSAQGGQLLFSLSQALVATTVPQPACAWQDDYGHGTHVAGIVAAATNNNTGVASLGYSLQVVGYKGFDKAGNGEDAILANAIMTAANAGIHVLSASWGSAGYSQVLQDAVNYAWQRNTLFIAAAGNDGANELFFPAGAAHAFGVSATDPNNNLAGFSNSGNIVSIAAPGVSIYSTMPTYSNTLGGPSGPIYDYLSGTSMATPHVSSLAGLLLATTPNVSMAAIAQRLQQSASSTNLNGGWDPTKGFGIINAYNALSGTPRPASIGALTGQITDASNHPVAATVTVSGQTPLATDANGLYRFATLPAGPYGISVTASGFPDQHLSATIAAGADTVLTIAMGVSYGKFTGTVKDAGVPVPGAIVQAIAQTQNGPLIQATAVTASDGAYELWVAPGTYDVTASTLSANSGTVAGQTVAASATTLVNLAIARFGNITGLVTNSQNSPVTGAQLSVKGAGLSFGAVTDSNGIYKTIGLPQGTYTVDASFAGFSDVIVNNVNVAPDTTATVNIQFGTSSPIPVYGTGTNSQGTLAADGTVDSHYTITASPDAGFPGPNAFVVTSNGLPGVWLPDGPNSKWIAPQSNQASGNAGGSYTYRTTFDLTGFNAATAVLTGQFAADDSATIKLNGVLVGPAAPTFSAWTPFIISGGFVAGINTLDFVVTNASGTNATGLRVDIGGTGSAAAIVATAGAPQSATINTAFATALQATVKDASSNPLSGVIVTFTAPSSGASAAFGGSTTATVATNGSGVATAPPLTANSQAGTYTVTASLAGVATKANFNLTNIAGAAASIAATAGTPQSATITAGFGTALQATVRDAGNNPVSGVTVTFTAPSPGPSAAFGGSATATAVTNSSGVATAPVLTANGQAGSYILTASVAGVAAKANYSLSNIAGAAGSIAATAGTPQSAAINAAFGTALQATVKDASNNPVNGVTVTFTAPSTGPSAAFSGSATATAVTNNSGVATAPALTANSQAGSYTVTASVAGVAAKANYSLTNNAGAAASIAATAGMAQSATINTGFGTALQATVKDAGNNPVSGVTVTFTAPSTGPSAAFAGSATATAVTNSSGVATAPALTANNQAGGYTVTASVAGVAAKANFSLTNNAGAAASIAATAGTPQSAAINTAFATALQATVKDAGNNPLSGLTVTFTAPATGASAAFGFTVNATAVTNSSGVATAPALTANGQAGSYTVTASVAGVAAVANFSLTNNAGAAASIAATAGTPQSATINTAFATPLQATVKDAGNNPLSGVTVTFTAPATGASAAFGGSATATVMTNSSGVATAPSLTANSLAGSYTVTASVAGVAAKANFSLTNIVGGAASIAATAGTPQSATINTAFTTPLQATVKDAGNNPLSGVTVTFTAPATGASAAFAGSATATAMTNSSGVATAPSLTANSLAGSYTVTASVAGVAAKANFSLTNIVGGAASIAATAGTPQSATINTAFTTPLQATVKDAGNNPLSGVTVTFTAPATGASAAFAGSATATAMTNSSGVATAPSLTANSLAGSYTVTASAPGVAAKASFSLTNMAGIPIGPGLLRDFRGIGRSDALLYDPVTGNAYTALSNGDGTYQYVAAIFTPGYDILRTGDFNGDGKSDLVVYNSHTGLAYIGMSGGAGTFAFQSLFWSPGYDVVEAGDLNGDGKTDFALYNSSTGTLYTAISNGTGTFTYKYHLVSTGFTFVRLADFTGDGKAGLFLYNAGNGVAFLGIGDGAGNFTFQSLSISPGYNLADIGDLNGDGKTDLLLYNSSNGNAATAISDGAGGFAFTPLIFSPGFTSARLADYTGDGKADVTVYNKTNAAAYFGTGTGSGTFSFQSLFWSPGYDLVEPQDVSGDKKADVVLYNSATGTEYTGVSNGTGGFTYTYSLWGSGKMLTR